MPTQPGQPTQPGPPGPTGLPGLHGQHAHRADPLPRPARRPHRARRWFARGAVTLLVLLLAGVTVGGVHLYRTSQAWQARSEEYVKASQELGTELAASRAELSGSQAELEAVRAQLTTAQERIVQLADEKARLGDDREVQLQLVDYQARVSEAAGRVALALEQCVQGQDKLIGYLQDAASYDPAELDQYGRDVKDLCETATEANAALQLELSR